MEKALFSVSGVLASAAGCAAVGFAAAAAWGRVRRFALWRMPRPALALFAVGAAVATLAAQKPSANPLYACSFDSADAVAHPAAGEGGVCNEGATFGEGKVGNALYVPAHTTAVEVPLSDGLPVAEGCVEFWAKLTGSKATFSSRGDPMFFRAIKPSDKSGFPALFVEFNSNNGGGCSGLVGGMPGIGLSSSSKTDTYQYSQVLGADGVSEWHHYALAWNTNGLESVEGNPRAALFLDGVKVSQIDDWWDATDYTEQMTEPLVLLFSDPRALYANSPYAIDEFRIWDYAKTTFSLEPDPEPVPAVEYEKDASGQVTAVRVPAGATADGAQFKGLANLETVAFAAGSAVSGELDFSGCAALREVVLPAAAELEPWTFLGCWNLARVVFAGAPPFGAAPAEADARLRASVRPASLLQMADAICYPVAESAKWEKTLRNLGYGGRFGAYDGAWDGTLIPDSGNLSSGTPGTLVITNTVVSLVSNTVVSVVTNVLAPPTPDAQPDARYAAQTGAAGETVLAGAAGWDAYGLPDGMAWDAATGTLSGAPLRSGAYDIMLVSGSGAETKLMRTTLEVAGYAVTTGYVGVAFKASGAPWNGLASYKNPPAGLAWSGKTLSGVPTKAGLFTYKTAAGEPVKIQILALPAGAKGTFNGVLADAAGRSYPVKVTASAAGKLSATVTKGTKTHTLAAAKWTKVTETVADDGAPHRVFAATLTAKGLSMAVQVDADAAWPADALTAVGTLGAVKGLSGAAQRNAYAASDDAKAATAARAGTYSMTATAAESGGWTLALTAAGVKGSCTVVLKATGAATLSGTLPDKAKTKVNASATLHVAEDGAAVLRFYVKGVWVTWMLPAPEPAPAD